MLLPLGKSGSTAPCPWEHFFLKKFQKFLKITILQTANLIEPSMNLISVNKDLFFPNFQFFYENFTFCDALGVSKKPLYREIFRGLRPLAKCSPSPKKLATALIIAHPASPKHPHIYPESPKSHQSAPKSQPDYLIYITSTHNAIIVYLTSLPYLYNSSSQRYYSASHNAIIVHLTTLL